MIVILCDYMIAAIEIIIKIALVPFICFRVGLKLNHYNLIGDLRL